LLATETAVFLLNTTPLLLLFLSAIPAQHNTMNSFHEKTTYFIQHDWDYLERYKVKTCGPG
jgi:hypothetical protein